MRRKSNNNTNGAFRARNFFERLFYASMVAAVFSCVFSLAGLVPVRPAYAAGASLYLAPAAGTYVLNGKFNVSVKVNSGGVVINAAEGAISYDTDLLEVTGISKGGSIFTLWTAEPVASGGTIRFGGGIPRPGYNGTSGQICTISFKAKRVGSAQVRFTSGAVLANDGKGTNVLSSMGSANYTISPVVTAPPKEEAPAPVVEQEYNKPVITSPTHPDQTVWYKNNTPEFKWTFPAAVTGVSLSLDQEASSDPGPDSDGLVSGKIYEPTKDGIWYFHLKYKDPKRWGTAAHYKIMIDTTPPLPFEVTALPAAAGELPELAFEAKDEGSGIKHYEVMIDKLDAEGEIVGADVHSYKAKELGAGEHTAIVKAVDNAGNEMYAKTTFIVSAIEAPVITDYPAEIEAGDKVFFSGTALPGVTVNVYVLNGDDLTITGTTTSDLGGNWFYISDRTLGNGRYVAWAEAVNQNGIKSGASNKVTFIVSPPIFARVGSFVINYFTVFVSLLFLIILIIALIFFLVGLLRRKLKKETVEIEEVLHRNLAELRGEIEEDLENLGKARGTTALQKEKEKVRARVKEKIESTEKKILKEIKDVEDILK